MSVVAETDRPRPFWYQGVRVSTRAVYPALCGYRRRYHYLLRCDRRSTWADFHCTYPFLTRGEAEEAARQAIDERIRGGQTRLARV